MSHFWARWLVSCVVELAIAEMACVSRNIRTAAPAAFGIPVQRSISRRDGSYPVVELGKAETASTSQPTRTSFFTMLALVWYSGPVLSVHPHVLCS